ncbi:hypothetical protein DQG13_08410 [Paenibacillus sp. YN15]|nr:hypothetical protein DQG13_08410 [Paenibacillus sp. YN15]
MRGWSSRSGSIAILQERLPCWKSALLLLYVAGVPAFAEIYGTRDSPSYNGLCAKIIQNIKGGREMKRKILLATILGSFFFSGIAFSEVMHGSFKGFPIVKLFIDGKEINNEVPAIVVDGNTLVPLRVISEALGREISWDGDSQSVFVGKKPSNSNAQSTNQNFEFSGLNDYYDDGLLGIYHVTGQVKNISGERTSRFIEITVTLLDKNKKVLRTQSGYLSSFGGLDNNETGSFDIQFINPPKNIAEYEVKVKSSGF